MLVVTQRHQVFFFPSSDLWPVSFCESSHWFNLQDQNYKLQFYLNVSVRIIWGVTRQSLEAYDMCYKTAKLFGGSMGYNVSGCCHTNLLRSILQLENNTTCILFLDSHLQLYSRSWPELLDALASASQVLGITGMFYYALIKQLTPDRFLLLLLFCFNESDVKLPTAAMAAQTLYTNLNRNRRCLHVCILWQIGSLHG